MEFDEIREELKTIRLFHRDWNYFKRTLKYEKETPEWYKRMVLYDEIIKEAPKRIQDVFDGLYRRQKTQKALAIEWGVCEKYVQILNKRLLVFLKPKLPDKPKEEKSRIEKKVESKTFSLTWFN